MGDSYLGLLIHRRCSFCPKKKEQQKEFLLAIFHSYTVRLNFYLSMVMISTIIELCVNTATCNVYRLLGFFFLLKIC